jgi:predicted nucleic acid-binding protein
MQEIIHRYVAIQRREAIQPAFEALLGVVDEVYPVEQADVEEAKKVLDGIPALSGRDALHVATMRRREVSRILSFDTGFDQVPGLERLAD